MVVAFDLHHCIGDVGIISLKVILVAVKWMTVRGNVVCCWVDEPNEAVSGAPKADAEEDSVDGLAEVEEIVISGWAHNGGVGRL